MACGCGNNSGGGNNPYAPGQPYSPGGPYCGNCYPYGPGFPSDPNAPTGSECVEDTTDPCAVKEQQTTPCPNGICDDRFQNLPPSKRVRLFGASGNCLYQFPNHSKGFVLSDERGQFVTNRPCIDMPFLKDYLRDPETGQIITDANGDPVEGPTPPVDSIIGVDECGCQNRIQGISGQRQRQIWDGEQFVFVNDVEHEENPLIDPNTIPIVDGNTCPRPLVAALIPSNEEAVGSCGEEETVFGYKLGGIQNFGLPAGVMQMWPGASDNVPEGWLLADGTPLNINDWPELFAAYGYSWGGSGNTFNLPDMRGYVPRGVDIDADRDPDKLNRTAIATGGNTGNAVGSVQDDQMQCFDIEYSQTQLLDRTITITTGPSITIVSNTPGFTLKDATITEGDCGAPRFGEETRMKNANVNFIVNTGCPPEVAE